MFDAYGRNIHYLRLSVTDLCNLRCRYCMPDGVPKLSHEDILTYEEFLRLAALFAQCGIDTVRITGGEPLVRRGVEQLTAGLKAIPGIRRVALTTNGVLLAQKLPALLAAGLDSVNISLDTLHPAHHRQRRACRRAKRHPGGPCQRHSGQAELCAAARRERGRAGKPCCLRTGASAAGALY